MTCNPPLWPLLGQVGTRIGPIQSVGWSYQALVPICFFRTILLNLHTQQILNPYLLGARRRWLRVNSCWENRNLTNVENLKLAMARKPTLSSSILVAYPHLNKDKWAFPLVHSQHRLGSVVGGGAQGQQKLYSIYKELKNKRNLSESDSENEAANFPRFIIIESLEMWFAKFSPFLRKSYFYNGYSKNC